MLTEKQVFEIYKRQVNTDNQETMAQYDDRARYKGTPYYDQGGVHYNSGIINRIGYTIIQNLGIEKAQTIFYSSLVNYLTPKAHQ